MADSKQALQTSMHSSTAASKTKMSQPFIDFTKSNVKKTLPELL
ncbi:MAG: hypothetical protein ACI9LY_002983 [Arenicella sp.]|jgi:hypothetical protein